MGPWGGTGQGAAVGGSLRRCIDGAAAIGGRAVVSNSGGEAPVVIDECSGVLWLEGDKGVRRGHSI
jgi:hypothetical protein